MADFHFLRPLWLLLLFSVPMLVVILRNAGHGDSGWSRLIPAPLLSPLIRSGGQQKGRGGSPLVPVSLALVILAVALAGPAWREAPTPLKQPGDSLVMVLDLSLSMLATDVEPDRLTRAKRKIRDILGAREGSLNGLVVYAADAHVVTPLTDDTRTIEAMLDVLHPTIMPAQGNRADLAVTRATELLQQGAPGKGRILLITDDVREGYLPGITHALAGTPYTLSTLMVGTEGGGPIPLAKRGFMRENGEIVITRADPGALSGVAAETGGSFHPLTLDDTDIEALKLTPEDSEDWQSADSDQTVNRWQDDGYWLLWLALPLLLLGWRRGGFAVLTLLVLPLMPEPAQAASWDSLWQREDQRAPELIREDPEQAARELESPSWRAPALYRSGEYEQAAKLYESLPGPAADYNRGNALARAGKLEQALEAYENALAQAPEMEDARHNRDLVEQLIEQQQQQQQQQQNQQGQGDSQQQQNQNSEGGSQDNPSQQSDDQQAGQQPSPSGEDPSGQSDSRQNNGQGEQESDPGQPKQDSGTGQKGESGEQQNGQQAQAPAEISETPLTQGQEQWLRRIPDNPGGLLRRKFLQQYQERQTPPAEGDTPW
ncbi:Ca-activated chloride channel family protein [Marinobacter pelagius]|uniref:Ca-activated chloride channel family protein n=1 Tax=Marinobacter pelagius TaxID=379482 RepID=A0A366GQW3_9GAMM|nr:VWA domain-containing protein [Marinobacter pelagius]RBP30056.1 Ca-activated chloride channel family protein [Marinobacter pelagius]